MMYFSQPTITPPSEYIYISSTAGVVYTVTNS